MGMKSYSALLGAGLGAVMICFASSSFAAQSTAEDDPLEQPLPPGIRVRAFIHKPRVVQPNHLGTCTPTNDESVAHYGLTGWHIPAAGMTWKLSEATVPATIGASAARAAIASAFATWTAADGGKQVYDGGSTAQKNTRFDGTNTILWKRLSASTIGVTYVWYRRATGEVVEADTAFNSRYPWYIFNSLLGECQSSPDAYDLPNIAVHEFGHWFGLDDLYDDVDRDLTMYGFGAGGELKKVTLGAGDITGLNAVAP